MAIEAIIYSWKQITKGFMRYMSENPECFDPKKPGREGMAEITDIVKIRMENLGSVGRA